MLISITRFSKSMHHAFLGVGRAYREGANLRIQSCAAVFALAFAVFLRVSIVEFCVILIMCGIVLCAEITNTALEHYIDLVEARLSQRVKIAKDILAGGVLILALTSVLVGFAIFGPRLWSLFFGVIAEMAAFA